MNTKIKMIAVLSLLLTQLSFISDANGAVIQSITPTDVFYLLKGVDESLMGDNGLNSLYTKQPLSTNINPRNVFQKIVNVIAEFNTLYPNSVSLKYVSSKVSKVGNNPLPSDVYDVVAMMKDALSQRSAYTRTSVEITTKTPSHVFQLLRQLSSHISEASTKKGINVMALWSPARVYRTNFLILLAGVQKLANEHGIAYAKYTHPALPESGKQPKDVFAVITSAHNRLSKYYVKSTNGNYTPLVLAKIVDKESITPVDVFDLTQLAIGELKFITGEGKHGRADKFRYSSWAKSTTVLPGHVFILVSYIERVTRNL